MSNKPQKPLDFNDEKELSNFLLGSLTDSLKQAIKATVKLMIKNEMEELRKTLDQKLSFNGYYPRQLISPFGEVPGIEVPRFRETPTSGLELNSLKIFEQEKERFLKIVAEMHRLGISQRKVKELCENCLGIKVSPNRVGLVHKELAKQEALQINQHPIIDDFEYLIFDGLWVNCQTWGLRENNKIVLLCALGVKSDGSRKILGFAPADLEDYNHWDEFIVGLRRRGLEGKTLSIIISDDNGGLRNALKHLFPTVPTQVCITHKMRNVINKTKTKNKKEVIADLKNIYNSETQEEAQNSFKQFAKKWYVVEPKAVESLRFNFEETLTYLSFPKDLWRKIRTSNLLEREFREVRRRIRVFDSSFNDEQSLMRYGNSIFDYLNNHYPASLHNKN